MEMILMQSNNNGHYWALSIDIERKYNFSQTGEKYNVYRPRRELLHRSPSQCEQSREREGFFVYRDIKGNSRYTMFTSTVSSV